jgi:hypothetical protein
MARAATRKTVETWVVKKPFKWQGREYNPEDEMTLGELSPGMELNEEMTAYYNANTFTYEKQNGILFDNGRSAPNMETRHVKLPIERK